MNTPSSPAHFIRNIIEEDNRTGKWNGRVETRFPPEPNGYLHIGHAKSICLNFGLALEYGGVCHLRFDDTNPEKEAQEYVDAIIESVRWLGFDWKEHLYYASDYFDQLYEFAEYLITQGKAYVDSLPADEIRRLRGTLTEAGTNSPYRDRSAEENLDLFRRMRAGEFPDGVHVLRARIDMASPNINLRDPVIYRIRHIHHQRTGDKWCIYPMYDYTHCISDALERITHSLCTLEFEDHRPLYDWVLDQLAEKNSLPSAANRICTAEPDLQRDEQTQADRSGRKQTGRWLERSTYEYTGWFASPWLYTGIDPPVRGTHWHQQGGFLDRYDYPGRLPA